MSHNPNPETPRRKQIRLRGYDYSQPGRYFVTVCALEKTCIFGEIHDGYFDPSPVGNIVRECWFELPYHYAGLYLDEFIVMPNHVHGVMIFIDPVGVGLKGHVNASRRRSVLEVVRAFKTFSGRRINEMRGVSGCAVWQRGYYEHIVRTDAALDEIRKYIRNNPLNWEKDPERSVSAVRGRVSNPPS